MNSNKQILIPSAASAITHENVDTFVLLDRWLIFVLLYRLSIITTVSAAYGWSCKVVVHHHDGYLTINSIRYIRARVHPSCALYVVYFTIQSESTISQACPAYVSHPSSIQYSQATSRTSGLMIPLPATGPTCLLTTHRPPALFTASPSRPAVSTPSVARIAPPS